MHGETGTVERVEDHSATGLHAGGNVNYIGYLSRRVSESVGPCTVKKRHAIAVQC